MDPQYGEVLDKRYEWLIVTGAFGAFLYGWGTGSNDVANAFGTSVGAKTLTLKQAVLMAAIFNFTGALVLGRTSAETISGGIAKAITFRPNPPLFAYGMTIVLWLGFLWQGFASYMGWNVSATHSVIGGIVGFAVTWGGTDSVFWAEPDSTKIPPFKGVLPIILSWFVSPVLTGLCSALIYYLTRKFVLTHVNSTARSVYILPIMVFLTVLIDVYFIFTRGAKKTFQEGAEDWSDEKALWIAAVVAAVCALLSAVIGIPFLRNRLQNRRDLQDSNGVNGDKLEHLALENDPQSHGFPNEESTNSVHKDARSISHAEQLTMSHVVHPTSYQASDVVHLSGSAFGNNETSINETVKDLANGEKALQQVTEDTKSSKDVGKTWKDRIFAGVEYDIHAAVDEDPLIAAMHEHAEKWEPDTEFIFGYLQVFSAICVIFAHGAGEVGYMAGPMAVIVNVCKSPANNVVTTGKKVQPEIWAILIGAFGLIIGLATYGYKVCQAVGTQMAKITPSRGYAAELATSFVIMIAAQFALPTSSSQCITGGIIGIACFEGSKGINFRLLGFTAMSWIWTMFVMGLGTSLIFSQGMYTPNRFTVLEYSNTFKTSFVSLCPDYNFCARGQYLQGCGIKSLNPPTFSMGTCVNCSVQARACQRYQSLRGCGLPASAGTCTNCSGSTKDVLPIEGAKAQYAVCNTSTNSIFLAPCQDVVTCSATQYGECNADGTQSCTNCNSLGKSLGCKPDEFIFGCGSTPGYKGTSSKGKCVRCAASDASWVMNNRAFQNCSSSQYLSACPGFCIPL